MEAARYSFATPGGSPEHFKFDPTDEDLVTHYLLPRALGLPCPYSHAVIEGDPGGLPPWEVLERHGIEVFSAAGADQAFFFGPAPDPDHNGGRMVRIVEGGGFWQGQKGEDGAVVFLRPGDGAEVEVTFNRYNLTFYDGKSERSTRFVMHEFEIVDPPHLNAMLTRVKFDKARERMAEKLAQEAAAAADADGGGEDGGEYCVDPLEVVFPRPGGFAGGGYTQDVLDNFYEKEEYEQFLLFEQYEMEQQQSWQTGDPSNGGEGCSGGDGAGEEEQQQQQQQAGSGSDNGSDVGTGGSSISHCGDGGASGSA